MRSRSAAAPALIAAAVVTAIGMAVLVGLASCRATPAADPLARVPALLIQGPALLRFLDRASSLADTPAGRVTGRLRSRLGDCAEIALAPPSGSRDASPAVRAPASPSAAGEGASPTSPIEGLACRDALDLAAPLALRLERARGSHAGILQWPVGSHGRIELRIDVDPRGGLELEGRLEPDDAMGPAGFLVPAPEPPAVPRIDARTALVHLHLRSASGTGLAALVPQDSQGDRLFALKGRLLEGALLEGTLELAFVEPAPTGRIPLAVVALHHRGAAPIAAALAEALAQLEQTWSIVPSPRRFAGAGGEMLEGGCYAELPLLPELAPCWVVTPDALLVGYRAEAIEAVLAGGPSPPRASGLVVDFERVRSLDRRLVAGRDVDSPQHLPVRLADLYTRLELRGAAEPDGAVDLRGRLEARP